MGKEPQCESFCAERKAPWGKKCSWDTCNGCSDCVGIAICPNWCETSTEDVPTKCSYGGCAKCSFCGAAMLQEREVMQENLASVEAEAESMPTSCTANNKYNSKQVSVCGCGSKRFPPGSTFLLNGKSLTVASSFKSACSKSCGKDYCATVNLDKAVGSGFSWKAEDEITFPEPATPAPVADCTANNKYNSKQVSVCGCGGK